MKVLDLECCTNEGISAHLLLIHPEYVGMFYSFYMDGHPGGGNDHQTQYSHPHSND